jgi:hypothetical protein
MTATPDQRSASPGQDTELQLLCFSSITTMAQGRGENCRCELTKETCELIEGEGASAKSTLYHRPPWTPAREVLPPHLTLLANAKKLRDGIAPYATWADSKLYLDHLICTE